MSNSDNPRIGKEFQERICTAMSAYFKTDFQLEIPIPIGEPPKPHRFDCVSSNRQIVIECKCYAWTAAGNIPSAKLRTLNEAVLYMSCLPPDTVKIIAMKKTLRPGKPETLAQYYNRVNGHLLKGIRIVEMDENNGINWVR